MGFEVTEEVMLAIVTAVGSFIAVLLVLAQTRKNKIENQLRLETQRIEMEKARDQIDSEREARYQAQIAELTKLSDERWRELQEDLEKLNTDNKLQIERRVRAETQAAQKDETIGIMQKQLTIAMDRAIEKAVAAERLEIEKAHVESENIKLNRLMEEQEDQLAELRKQLRNTQEIVNDLKKQLANMQAANEERERQHDQEIKALAKRINDTQEVKEIESERN